MKNQVSTWHKTRLLHFSKIVYTYSGRYFEIAWENDGPDQNENDEKNTKQLAIDKRRIDKRSYNVQNIKKNKEIQTADTKQKNGTHMDSIWKIKTHILQDPIGKLKRI